VEPGPRIPEDQLPNVTASTMAQYLITNVLRDTSRLGTFFESRLIRDLTYKSATGSTGGMYFNESSQAFDGTNQRQPFDFNIAYDSMVAQRARINSWEQKRFEVMKQRGIIK
jgi:hypothetical protein